MFFNVSAVQLSVTSDDNLCGSLDDALGALLLVLFGFRWFGWFYRFGWFERSEFTTFNAQESREETDKFFFAEFLVPIFVNLGNNLADELLPDSEKI